MLREAFENVAPYLSDIDKIREFVKENEEKDINEVIKDIEERIEMEKGTSKTDFKILLNELRKIINMEM